MKIELNKTTVLESILNLRIDWRQVKDQTIGSGYRDCRSMEHLMSKNSSMHFALNDVTLPSLPIDIM